MINHQAKGCKVAIFTNDPGVPSYDEPGEAVSGGSRARNDRLDRGRDPGLQGSACRCDGPASASRGGCQRSDRYL